MAKLIAIFTLALLSASTVAVAQSGYQNAEQLVKKYGCTKCHAREVHQTGPSFDAIRNRTRIDLTNFDLAFLQVNATEDIPQNRRSTVYFARVGEQALVRAFDADGHRVVDKILAQLPNDDDPARALNAWAKGEAIQASSFSSTDKKSYLSAAAELGGLSPANLRNQLIHKIKNGSKGSWSAVSKGVPMPPFGNRMSDEEIARVVDWIITRQLGFPLRLMATGLGKGTIVSSPAGINCGGDCDEAYTSGQVVTLTANADADSTFLRWEGDAIGSTNSVNVTMDSPRSVRAVFGLATPIVPLTDLTPEGIRDYLNKHPHVNTPSRFLKALPDVFKQNWILMTRSESLQTGTVTSPRILLPSPDAQAVFTIGLSTDASYPGSHPNAIEYMQWDPTQLNFRFHEIVLDAIPAMGNDMPDPAGSGAIVKTFPARSRGVTMDDVKCSKCHSTRNVVNNSSFPGTSDAARNSKVKNKPNWDAYDSWGGMMPLNRDRIYKGSVEAAAFRWLFNLWNWRANTASREIIEQLELQPAFGTLSDGQIDPIPRVIPTRDKISRMAGGENDGHIVFGFDSSAPVVKEPSIVGDEPPIDTNYQFNGTNSGPISQVQRGGEFVFLHHTSDVEGIDVAIEGRGVQLFDTLGGFDGKFNALRVIDEVIHHKVATGNVNIDVRPIALAINNGLITIDAASDSVIGTIPLTVDQSFFTSRNGLGINAIFADTRTRAESVPRRKIDIQKFNLTRSNDAYTVAPFNNQGLIERFGSLTSSASIADLTSLRQEVFRRPLDLGANPGGDKVTGFFVDREDYNANIEKVALFRYFLEPLGVPVDKWSMGVRGRSRTYSFADVFSIYIDAFTGQLVQSLKGDPTFPLVIEMVGGQPRVNDVELMNAVNASLGALPDKDSLPTYTDIQRIFNKSCIECHGGLNYPPYSNFDSAGFVDLSENEAPAAGDDRLHRAYNIATIFTNVPASDSRLFQLITSTNEECTPDFAGMMPCGGPGLSSADIQTIRRWIEGGSMYSVGDPHLRTVEGVLYDFQAAGEFTYLKGQSFELQVRQVGVSTQRPVGPDAYTGLTSCVSVNGAAALKLGKVRLTYQPGPNGMELRINGERTSLPALGVQLPPSGRVKPAPGGGIRIDLPGATTITLTPTFWEHYKLWYLNIDLRNVRATEGLLGSIAPGNWLPALPDGKTLGPRPESLFDRHQKLYDEFGNAWRVTDANSLFDYASGTSTKSFTFEKWPGFQSSQCEAPLIPNGPIANSPQEPISPEKAKQLTQNIRDDELRKLAITDLVATGELSFVKAYEQSSAIRLRRAPPLPTLRTPDERARSLNAAPSLTWSRAVDAPAEELKYQLLVWPTNEFPDESKAITITADEAKAQVITKVAPNVQPGRAYYWKVIVEDSQGERAESVTRRFQLK